MLSRVWTQQVRDQDLVDQLPMQAPPCVVRSVHPASLHDDRFGKGIPGRESVAARSQPDAYWLASIAH
jgi:hypothetical protein